MQMLTIFTACLLFGAVYAYGDECPTDYVKLTTGCYQFTNQSNITWCEAYLICKFQLKGYLVEIEDQQEQDAVKSYIQTVYDPAAKYAYWLGATDMLQEGQFQWMTSVNLMKFNAWNDSQPDNFRGDEDCVMIHSVIDYNWNDLDCSLTYISAGITMKGICEWSPFLLIGSYWDW